MRLRFGELSSSEQATRDAVCGRAREAWCSLREGALERARDELASIDARVEPTFVSGEPDGAPRVELCALEPSAWPLAQLMLEQAPRDLGHLLSLGRPALPLASALDEVRASHGLELSRATLRAGFGRGHLLELTLGIPGGTGGENEQNAAENLARAVLGDRLFETWVGAVHALPAPRLPSLRVLDVRAPKHALTVSDLFATVAAAALGVLRGLPEEPRASSSLPPETSVDVPTARDTSREEWSLLEVEPLARERGQRKDDLLLASTRTPELLRCYLDGAPCSSRRFSRSGEQFVFVSYADEQRSMTERVQRRTVIEMALSDSVTGLGAVTGVGFGVENTYVDFALYDLEAGLERLVAGARALALPRSSFIQFFDSELAEEWLSIWPNTRLYES